MNWYYSVIIALIVIILAMIYFGGNGCNLEGMSNGNKIVLYYAE